MSILPHDKAKARASRGPTAYLGFQTAAGLRFHTLTNSQAAPSGSWIVIKHKNLRLVKGTDIQPLSLQ
jgi:hypothetical protein